MLAEHRPLLLHSHELDLQEPAWHAQSVEQSFDVQGVLQTPFTQFCPCGHLQVLPEHAPLALHSHELDLQEPAWHAQLVEQSVDVHTGVQTPLLHVSPVGQLQVVSEHAPPALHSHLPDLQEPALHGQPLEQSFDEQGPQIPFVQVCPVGQLQVALEHAPSVAHSQESFTQKLSWHAQPLEQSVNVH